MSATQPPRAGLPSRRVKVALVTNIPAPYRVPVFDRLAQDRDIDLHVFYSAQREPDRRWDLPELAHSHTFLQERFIARNGRFIHNNPDVFGALRAFSPDVVVTTGFNPTHLFAYGYAELFRRKHVAMTDGTLVSEAGLSALHRAIRHWVLGRSQAFVAASGGGRALFRSYGVADEAIHASHLCANTSVPWSGVAPCAPGLDFLFSGRLVDIKNPLFALRVAGGVARRLGRRVSLGILGIGPLQTQVQELATELAQEIDVRIAGHVSQQDIPAWFAGARVFLFPTSGDVWGVVANEACLAGVPTIVSPHTGVAGELICDGANGFVRPLDLGAWTEAAVTLVTDDALHARMARDARARVAPYSFESAAGGIADAARMALRRHGSGAPRSSQRRRKVVCIQRRLTHYRVPLFEALRQRLAVDGVDFELVHGDPAPSERAKADEGSLPWAQHVPTRYMLNERLCWQNALQSVRGADLVIVTHENKLLFNLLAATLWRPKRLAFWGHGRNFQARRPTGLLEAFKRWTIGQVDWWFVYTSASRVVVEAQGFASDCITDLENAVDTATLMAECAAVTPAHVQAFRTEWRLGDGPVAVFVGSLYADKRLGFLIEAANALARAVPDFRLVMVGDGPQRAFVEAAAEASPCLRYLGTRFGAQKAIALRAATLMLNPGALGLGVLDAFASGLPLVTTTCAGHGPEVAYLRHGENGMCTPDNVAAFATAAADLLNDESARSRMALSALADARYYTLENMVENFRRGILQALGEAAR